MEGREWKRYEANRHQRESWKGPPYLLTKQQQNKIHNQSADGGSKNSQTRRPEKIHPLGKETKQPLPPESSMPLQTGIFLLVEENPTLIDRKQTGPLTTRETF